MRARLAPRANRPCDGYHPGVTSAPTSFPFRFERRYRLAAAPFGVNPRSTSIVVAGGQLHVRFGWWGIDTPLANIAAVSRTGGYAVPADRRVGPGSASATVA